MKAQPTRLRVEQIEDRLMPSGTPLDVMNAVQTIHVNTAVLQFITDKQLIGNAFTMPFVAGFLNYVNVTNTAAVAEVNDFMTTLFRQNVGNAFTSDVTASALAELSGVLNEGEVGISYAQSFAGVLSLTLSTPTSPAGPADSGSIPGGNNNGNNNNGGNQTIDLTSDSGMVNTLPTISGFTDLGDGVKIKDVQVGQGNTAAVPGNVTVYYTGWLNANGTIFDARRSPGSIPPSLGNFPNGPATFDLGNTIAGFQEGVAGMQLGGIREIFIPSAKGYGNNPQASIPANSDLVFEVKLIATS